MQQLTWRELAALPMGQRVVFVTDHDIFPEAIVNAGTTGVIAGNDLNEISSLLRVLPDSESLRSRLSHWNGEIYLYPDLRDGIAAWRELCPLAVGV